MAISRRNFLKGALPLTLLPLLHKLPATARMAQGDDNRPNIIVVVFDALSARHMSLHGYDRSTTPNLKRLTQRATVYHRHYAAGNFTTPGTASLLTGLYPWKHRAFHIQGTVAEDAIPFNAFRQFSQAGYDTLAYTQNDLANILLRQFAASVDTYYPLDSWDIHNSAFSEALFGALRDDPQLLSIMHNALYEFGGSSVSTLLNRKLDDDRIKRISERYAAQYPRGLPMNETRHSFFLLDDVINQLTAQLKAQVANQTNPFFSYFHLLPPHSPYHPPAEYVGMFEGDGVFPVAKPLNRIESYKNGTPELMASKSMAYDEFVTYVDAEFGRFYNQLEQAGVLDNSYLIFTSDHGELFERSMYGHVMPYIYDGITRIPLVIFEPGQTQRRDVHSLTSCVDVLPTLLQLADHKPSVEFHGQVLPTFTNAPSGSEPSVFTVEARRNHKQQPLTTASLGIVHGEYKLLHYQGYANVLPFSELYNIAQDPHELEDLSTQKPQLAADLLQMLESAIAA